MSEIVLSKVFKRYGPVEVVHGIDLEIRDKEFIVLVGPSGCGKSTLLRMIAGLEEISEGEIRIGDEVVNDLEPRDQPDRHGFFRTTPSIPTLSVAENVGFGLRMRKFVADEIRKRVGDAARVLQIDSYLERTPRPAFGRPTSTRGNGPRDRASTKCLPFRRTVE